METNDDETASLEEQLANERWRHKTCGMALTETLTALKAAVARAEQAEVDARILAHAWSTGGDPPPGVAERALAYDAGRPGKIGDPP